MSSTIGVVVGRFQIDCLHQGHISLLSFVRERHERVIVFLGVSALSSTKRDPLDYPTREKMIKHIFPHALVLPIQDTKDDEEWSKTLDHLIRTVYPKGSVTLYGGRKSFIANYKGQFDTEYVEECDTGDSATKKREEIGNKIGFSPDFRAGIIHAIENQWDVPRIAVDIGMYRKTEIGTYVLLGRKLGETAYRFPGGMVDSDDDSLESAAKRELAEEANLLPEGSLTYLGSYNIDDWRFLKAGLSLKTAFFTCQYNHGHAEAGDDLTEVEWIKLEDLLGVINPNHFELATRLVQHIKGLANE